MQNAECKMQKKKEILHSAFVILHCCLKWSGQVDLNHRPHGPEPCALTRLSYAPWVEGTRFLGESRRPVKLRGIPCDSRRVATFERFHPMKRISTILLVLLAGAAAMAQQQPPPSQQSPQFGEKIDVNVVLLDAIVTDSRGRQILGLGPDDFTVT